MSFFEDASLVLIPSAQKTSKVYSVKPTDGTGDLTFTRSNDTATRVGPDGLIEKVRTNLLLQSNTFSTTWTNTNTTETIGQTGYDGTSNAWLLNITGGTDSQHINQSISTSGSATFSVYAKAGTKNWVLLLGTGGTNPRAFFDLQNGVVGTQISSVGKIVSVGNGWYRCSISHTESTGSVRIYVATGDDDIAQASGNILIQAAQLQTGDIATDYIATTTAAVSVGPVANVPRLDYLNSSCPRLLLEPQRTNLALYSEQLNNAVYSSDSTMTVTANSATSPDGNQNADTITSAIAGLAYFYQNITVTNGLVYTVSAFAKAGTTNILQLDTVNNARGAYFNLTTGAIEVVNGTAKIENYGNGWYRCSVTDTAISTGGVVVLMSPTASGSATSAIGNSIYAYGCQLEEGAYATSYIPTLGAAVTRGADTYQKGGFGNTSTAGTFFCEFEATNITSDNGMYLIGLGVGTTDTLGSSYANAAGSLSIIANGPALQGRNNGYADNLFTISPAVGSTQKIAIRYDGTNVVAFVNGVKQSVLTDNAVGVKNFIRINNGEQSSHATKQLLFFPTALTDAQCIELTA